MGMHTQPCTHWVQGAAGASRGPLVRKDFDHVVVSLWHCYISHDCPIQLQLAGVRSSCSFTLQSSLVGRRCMQPIAITKANKHTSSCKVAKSSRIWPSLSLCRALLWPWIWIKLQKGWKERRWLYQNLICPSNVYFHLRNAENRIYSLVHSG